MFYHVIMVTGRAAAWLACATPAAAGPFLVLHRTLAWTF